MSKHSLFAAVLCVVIAPTVSAQTVRLTTNVGSFDMTLNRTDDSNLDPLVEILVACAGLGRRRFSAVNRAADGDPLQTHTHGAELQFHRSKWTIHHLFLVVGRYAVG